MNNKDDFGQYTCIAENVHGRMETIVFVLEESMTTTMTSERTHRLSKHYSSKLYSNRSLIRMSKRVCLSNECISFRNSYDNNTNKQYFTRTWYSTQLFLLFSSLHIFAVFLSFISNDLSRLNLFVCTSCVCVHVCYSDI